MSVVTEDLRDGVRVLTLNRPPVNAVDLSLLSGLEAACRDAADDPAVRAVIVRGGAKAFSAGLDLVKMVEGELEQIRDLGFRDGLFALWTLPKPTVAQIEGHAIAGGALIALACDHRVMAAGRGKIGLNESAIGIPFPLGALEIARSALDARSLREVILGARLYEASAAVEVGLVREAVPAEAVAARALEVATALAGHDPTAFAANKALLLQPHLLRLEEEPEERRRQRHAALLADTTRAAFTEAAARLARK